MRYDIKFTCNRKEYKGSIVPTGNDMWWVALSNGNSYLLAIDEEGWFCPSLKREIAVLIGNELNKKLKINLANK